jgi:hypothetical protein
VDEELVDQVFVVVLQHPNYYHSLKDVKLPKQSLNINTYSGT